VHSPPEPKVREVASHIYANDHQNLSSASDSLYIAPIGAPHDDPGRPCTDNSSDDLASATLAVAEGHRVPRQLPSGASDGSRLSLLGPHRVPLQPSSSGSTDLPAGRGNKRKTLLLDAIRVWESLHEWLLDKSLARSVGNPTPADAERIARGTATERVGIEFSRPLFDHLAELGLVDPDVYRLKDEAVGGVVHVEPDIRLVDHFRNALGTLWRDRSTTRRAVRPPIDDPRDYADLCKTTSWMRHDVRASAKGEQPKGRRHKPKKPGPYCFWVYDPDTARLSVESDPQSGYPRSLDLSKPSGRRKPSERCRPSKNVTLFIEWLCKVHALKVEKCPTDKAFTTGRDAMEGLMYGEFYHFIDRGSPKSGAPLRERAQRVVRPVAGDDSETIIADLGPDQSAIDRTLPNEIKKKIRNFVRDVNRYVKRVFNDESAVLLYGLRDKNLKIIPGERAAEREADWGVNVLIVKKWWA
jgi:hypothetical protein